MNKGFAARVIVGAALVAGSIGVPTAAYAAPTSQSVTSHVAAASVGLPTGLDCGIVYTLAAPLLGLGLPLDLVLDLVFNKLGSKVPLPDIRSCFGL